MLQKSVQMFCLLLLLAVQVLAAQHATVHPVEATTHSAYAQTGHQDHQDHDAADKACDLCGFLAAVSHGLIAPSLFALTALMAFALAYQPFSSSRNQAPRRLAGYFAQAPPVSFS